MLYIYILHFFLSLLDLLKSGCLCSSGKLEFGILKGKGNSLGLCHSEKSMNLFTGRSVFAELTDF